MIFERIARIADVAFISARWPAFVISWILLWQETDSSVFNRSFFCLRGVLILYCDAKYLLTCYLAYPFLGSLHGRKW